MFEFHDKPTGVACILTHINKYTEFIFLLSELTSFCCYYVKTITFVDHDVFSH